MVIDQAILDNLTAQAKTSPRLRMNLDLRNSPADNSQRMLNAIEPGTVMPIHRHRTSSETVVCLRGHFEEYFYDDAGNLTDTFDMLPAGLLLNVPAGQWHSLKSLESGTVLLECKDGAYEPLMPEDMLTCISLG
ncbi:MAG: WbuC family cupin fold metalloprotein [Bacteroidales bacterium]|nr:WbuC family cupin fold metalloprotein [Bacteroidales bacterium]